MSVNLKDRGVVCRPNDAIRDWLEDTEVEREQVEVREGPPSNALSNLTYRNLKLGSRGSR